LSEKRGFETNNIYFRRLLPRLSKNLFETADSTKGMFEKKLALKGISIPYVGKWTVIPGFELMRGTADYHRLNIGEPSKEEGVEIPAGQPLPMQMQEAMPLWNGVRFLNVWGSFGIENINGDMALVTQYPILPLQRWVLTHDEYRKIDDFEHNRPANAQLVYRDEIAAGEPRG
jgi:hypothetical protein